MSKRSHAGREYGAVRRRKEGESREGPGGEADPPRRDCVFASDPRSYTRPCADIARATLMNPAMLAPTTKFPGEPNSSAASEQIW